MSYLPPKMVSCTMQFKIPLADMPSPLDEEQRLSYVSRWPNTAYILPAFGIWINTGDRHGDSIYLFLSTSIWSSDLFLPWGNERGGVVV